MDDAPEPLLPETDEPVAENRRKRQNVTAQIILGGAAALALVVVIAQLTTLGSPSTRGGQHSEPPSVNPQEPDPAPAGSTGLATAPPEEPPAVAPRAEPEDVSQRAMTIAGRLGEDTASLVGIVADLSDRLKRAEEELRGSRALYAGASRKIAGLERELLTARSTAAEVKILQRQLAESRALLNISERRADELMKKLAESPDPKLLSEAQAMRRLYEAELRDTKDRLARDAAENARLRTDLDAATRELAATAEALESTEIFIDSIELLPDAAKQLFLELSRLETVNRTELAKNYQMIEEKLGARVVDSVRFATGSSEVNPKKVASVRAAISRGDSDSFFLVIGYASKTGTFEINKALSEARATAVATVADASKRSSQRVRAVFLGQTDRFSATNVLDDQICELWEVPKNPAR